VSQGAELRKKEPSQGERSERKKKFPPKEPMIYESFQIVEREKRVKKI